MGSSSSSTNSSEEANEQFHFRFTDCSCKCDASKKRSGENDISQNPFLNAIMTQMGRSEYDIRCDCDCGEGVKMGFLFGNTQQPMTDNH